MALIPESVEGRNEVAMTPFGRWWQRLVSVKPVLIFEVDLKPWIGPWKAIMGPLKPF